VDLKRILRVLLPALLLVLVLLGFFKVRAALLSHVYAPDAHSGSGAAGISPATSQGAGGDAADVGGGQTEDGFVIPVYNGEEIVPINNNVPGFADEESGTAEFYEFSELDELGRPGPAMGCIGPSMLATEERGPIGMIRPAGWHTVK
jgi:DNA-entry nuclease